MRRTAPLALAALLALAGCRSAEPLRADAAGALAAVVTFEAVDGRVEGDSALAALVEPYAAGLRAEMAEVVATAPRALTKGAPESALGNLTADAMLAEAERALGRELAFSVGNAGGLRKPIGPGPITRRDVFELMPFENFLVVVTLSASQVDSLAQQLARVGGEPVSGLSFAITPEGRAANVRVRGEPLVASGTYEVVTHNYLAYGGGDMPALWAPLATHDLGTTLRDVFLAYFARLGTLDPRLDGRITLQQP